MYTSYFGLRELPFNNTPDPRFFYSTPDHEEALASLIYAVQERKGFVLLTGEVGAGKTLISRLMIRHFGGQVAFANINHVVQNTTELMESLCAEFELPFEAGMSNTQLVRVLHDFLLARFAENTPVVLVLDEAQNLPDEAFEQLRMIGNLEADDAKLLQIAIIGQPELQQRFLSPQMRQLRQRIFRSFHLPALGRQQTEEYIKHRMSVAGATELNVFDAHAIDLICDASRCVPRVINTICDNAMLGAYSVSKRKIDGPQIESVVAQMMAIGGNDDLTGGNYPASNLLGSANVQQASSTQIPERRAGWNNALSATDTVDAPLAQRIFAEIDALRQDSSSRDVDFQQRLHSLEQLPAGVAPQLDTANRTMDELQQTLADVRTVVTTAHAVNETLEGREDQLRRLTQTMTTVVGEVRNLLERTSEATTRTRHAEEAARKAHDRLAEQYRKAHHLSNRLSEALRRVRFLGAHAMTSLPFSSNTSVNHTTDETHGANPSGNGTANLERFLSGTRQSLSDLSDLMRATVRDHAYEAKKKRAVPQNDANATNRLANQVDDLLTAMKL